MELNNLQKGDVVQLKSGGPSMTLSKIEQNDIVICQWFDEDYHVHSGTFNIHSVQKCK